jgi:hypothetical protein
VIAKEVKLIKIPLLVINKQVVVALAILIIGQVIFALSIFIAKALDVLSKFILPDNISELVIDILVVQVEAAAVI